HSFLVLSNCCARSEPAFASPLDNQDERCILPPDPQEECAYGGQVDGSRPRHSGHAHPENASTRIHAWLWHRCPNRTDEQRRLSRQCRFAVCRLSAVAARRTDQERMEGHGEQQASEVL